MQIVSLFAIYFLIWFVCLFLVLPFGVKTTSEEGEHSVPGHAESAPHSFRFGTVLLRTTIVSAIIFALFYANYLFGWIGADALAWLEPGA